MFILEQKNIEIHAQFFHTTYVSKCFCMNSFYLKRKMRQRWREKKSEGVQS